MVYVVSVSPVVVIGGTYPCNAVHRLIFLLVVFFFVDVEDIENIRAG